MKVKATKEAETKWKRLTASAMKEGVSVEDYAVTHHIDLSEIPVTDEPKPAQDIFASKAVVWSIRRFRKPMGKR